MSHEIVVVSTCDFVEARGGTGKSFRAREDSVG